MQTIPTKFNMERGKKKVPGAVSANITKCASLSPNASAGLIRQNSKTKQSANLLRRSSSDEYYAIRFRVGLLFQNLQSNRMPIKINGRLRSCPISSGKRRSNGT